MAEAAHSTKPGRSGSLRRVSGIDAARTLAAMGTVWVHAMQFPETERLSHLGRYSVPFFAFIAAWFLVARVRSKPQLRLPEHASDRFNRLYVPFLYWSATYLMLRYIKQWTLGGLDEPVLDPGMLLVGRQHLWFLPFLCFWLVAAFQPVRWASGNRKREIGLAVIAFVAGIVLTVTAPDIVPDGVAATEIEARVWWEHMLVNWHDRLPAFMWGLTFGLLIRKSPSKVRTTWGLAPLYFAVWAGCLVAMAVTNHQGGALQNIAGIGLLGLALLPWPNGVVGFLGKWSSLSYGVYLNHMIFIEGLGVVFGKLGWEPSFRINCVRFVLALVMSFVAAALLKKWWVTRPMVP